MAKTLERVEIFSTGRFRPSGSAAGKVVTITENDITQMVNSFNELAPIGGFTPVLKLGHNDAQRFMGQADGAPNLGIVEKIWKEGSKVLANFSNVPDAVIDLIRGRRFNSVSVEVVPTLEFGGNKFSNVLTAVALLGAQLPAVKGLSDLASTLFTRAEVTPIEAENVVAYEQENQTMPDPVNYTEAQHNSLVEAAVAAAKVKFQEDLDKLQGEVTTVRDALKAKTDEFTELQGKVTLANATNIVDGAIKAGKILPKEKDAAVSFTASLSGDQLTAYSALLETTAAKVDLGESAEGSADDGGETEKYEDARDEVAKRVDKVRKDNADLSYADAMKQVFADDEELKNAYVAL